MGTHRERLQHAADGGAVEVQSLADARVARGHAKLLAVHRKGHVTNQALRAGVWRLICMCMCVKSGCSRECLLFCAMNVLARARASVVTRSGLRGGLLACSARWGKRSS